MIALVIHALMVHGRAFIHRSFLLFIREHTPATLPAPLPLRLHSFLHCHQLIFVLLLFVQYRRCTHGSRSKHLNVCVGIFLHFRIPCTIHCNCTQTFTDHLLVHRKQVWGRSEQTVLDSNCCPQRVAGRIQFASQHRHCLFSSCRQQFRFGSCHFFFIISYSTFFNRTSNLQLVHSPPDSNIHQQTNQTSYLTGRHLPYSRTATYRSSFVSLDIIGFYWILLDFIGLHLREILR